MSQVCFEKPITATRDKILFANADLIDRLLRNVREDEAYEEGESRPSLDVIKAASLRLSLLPAFFRRTFEVHPYFGEINVTWQNRANSTRVKAIFGPAANSFRLYCEQMLLDRVTNRELISHATQNEFLERLVRLYSAA